MKGSYLLLLIILCGCFKPDADMTVEKFEMFSNYSLSSDTLTLEMDLSRGPFKGITLPSDSATGSRDYFHLNFDIQNKGATERFFYKIYYRNISYKHADYVEGEFNPKSSENFYGSWSGIDVPRFKLTKTIKENERIEVKDSIRIMGNPFNEPRFFGPDPRSNQFDGTDVVKMIKIIQSNPDWLSTVEDKALASNQSLEDQLRFDAIWTLRNTQSKDTTNLRFRNNPRVGLYEFMLVIGRESLIESIPEYAFNHELTNPETGVRSNPFYFFPEAEKKSNLIVQKSDQHLRTYAILKPDYGLYYDQFDFKEAYSGSNCGNDTTAFESAHFIQYINTPVLDSSLNNIDQVLNVTESMTLKQFRDWAENLERNQNSFVSLANKPCKNASHDADQNVILVKNPGNSEKPYRKENGGIEGRFGFTFGKFKARIEFPELLSQENVWNGVTCAFWLKFLSLDEWNTRDECKTGEGYALEYLGQDKVKRGPRSTYSEIDIEIVKAAKHWPPLSYSGHADTVDFDDPSSNRDLIIACTNWDLACKDPSQFGVGVKAFNEGDNTYYTHRWGDWYKALTSKNPHPHDNTVGQPMWYEIDWKPTSLTWRVGETKETMQRICFMDSSITKIPNNAMNPVVSQEFHYGHWWPTTPFPQGDIPYPKNDIVGKVIEIRVE
jgi:hypothetical protein